jgi:hypothetical protein
VRADNFGGGTEACHRRASAVWRCEMLKFSASLRVVYVGCDIDEGDLARVPEGSEAKHDEFLNAVVASWNLWWLLQEKLQVLATVRSCKGVGGLPCVKGGR